MAIKGRSDLNIIVGQPGTVDVTVQGKKIKRGFRVWPVGVGVIKTELYGWLRLEPPIEGEIFPAGYCHFPEYGQEFFEQLTAEQVVTRLVNGFKVYFWEKTRDRNEAIDCRGYARAAASAFGMDRFSSRKWDSMAADVGSIPQPEPVEDKTEGTETPAPRPAVIAKPTPVKPKGIVRKRRENSFWK